MFASKTPILFSVDEHKYPEIQAFLKQHSIPFYFKSFIQLTFLPFTIPEKTSWVFVSSPNVMPHILRCTKNPLEYKWGVVGQSSARRLEALGVKPSFIGSGSTELLANELSTKLNGGDKIWFPISNLSKRSVQKKLNTSVFEESVVYLNHTVVLDEAFKTFKGNVFFTSPSNAKNFLEQHVNKATDCSLFAIGKTTKDEIVKFGLSATCSSGYEPTQILELVKTLYT